MSAPTTFSDELTISASAFKAQCLDIMTQLESGKLHRVTVTRRGRSVAFMQAQPAAKSTTRFGSGRGLVIPSSPDFDFTGSPFSDEELAAINGDGSWPDLKEAC